MVINKINKVFITGLITTSFLASIASASCYSEKELKEAYKSGLQDALVVLDKDITNYNKKVRLKGYGVYIDITNIPIIDIIRYEALGIKLGLNPIIIDNKLYFSIEIRKADANLIKKEIMKNSSLRNIKIKKIDTIAKYSSIIENFLKKQLPQKAILVYVKEKENIPIPVNKEIKKIVVTSTDKLHFVNRVLTRKALEKYCKGQINRCSARINICPQAINYTKHNVKKTIGKKELSLNGIDDFYTIANIISHYGVITKDNKLLIGKHYYEKGDKIGKFVIDFISYSNGVIVIDRKPIKVKAEKGN